jgi:hypothetical protein
MDSQDISHTFGDKQVSLPPKAIVCVYAPSDEPFYRTLQTYLSIRQRQHAITWLEIHAGDRIEQTIQEHLQQADLILLLWEVMIY